MPDPAAQAALLARGRDRAGHWLGILDTHMLAGRDYVAGIQPTIADYLGVAYVTLGDWIGFDFSHWPRVRAWIERMRARPAGREEWARHDAFAAYLASLRASPAAASSG